MVWYEKRGLNSGQVQAHLGSGLLAQAKNAEQGQLKGKVSRQYMQNHKVPNKSDPKTDKVHFLLYGNFPKYIVSL